VADSNLKLDRLKLLYDYTKFHIGMYGTLMAVFSGIMTFGSQALSLQSLRILKIAVLLLLIAAMSGGVVASSMLDVYQNYGIWKSDGCIDAFWTKRIGPLKLELMSVKKWWLIEHTAFWVAVLIVIGGFLLRAS